MAADLSQLVLLLLAAAGGRLLNFIMSLVEYLTSKVAYTIQRGSVYVLYARGGSVYFKKRYRIHKKLGTV